MRNYLSFISTLVFLFNFMSRVTNNTEVRHSLVYKKSGNVTVTGIFNGFTGSQCDIQSTKALEEMAATIWIVEALNEYKFLSGLTIGLSIFEKCMKKDEDQKNVLKAIDESFSKDTLNLGIITTLDVDNDFLDETTPLLTRVKHIINEKILINLVVQLLANLQWMTVDAIFFESENVSHLFAEKASAEKICVYNKFLITESSKKQNSIAKESGVIVVIMASDRILDLFNVTDLNSKEQIEIILAPTDLIFDVEKAPTNSIVLLPSIGSKKILTQFIQGNNEHKDFFHHREPTKSPLFIGVALSILNLIIPLKEVQSEVCNEKILPSNASCLDTLKSLYQDKKDNLTKFSRAKTSENSLSDIVNVFKILKLDPHSSREMSLYIATLVINDTSEDAALFQLFNIYKKNFSPILLKINNNFFFDFEIFNGTAANFNPFDFNKEKLESEFNVAESLQSVTNTTGITTQLENKTQQNKNRENAVLNQNSSEEIFCSNRRKSRNYIKITSTLMWRNHTWVTVNTCLSLIGLLGTTSIMLFIAGRICKGDTYEGSSTFIILLMASVILTFITTWPFYIRPSRENLAVNQLICRIRINGPPLVYSILFSLILSRGLMLATSESRDGFISHVNGYLQLILFLCLVGIQISLTSQNLLFNRVTNYKVNCPEVHSGFNILIFHIYNLILLSFLIFLTPFIIRLQRNHREGLLLSFSIFSIALIWIAWMSSYFVLPAEYKDAVLGFGLNGTGIILLIFVFTPRAYLMMIAIVRNRTGNTLPSLNQNILPEISDVNFKCNESITELSLENGLCETLNIGLSNPNFTK